MARTYDVETEKRLETRKRNAQLRRAEQIRKRNNLLLTLCGMIVVLIFISIVIKSCSSNQDSENIIPATSEEKLEQLTVSESTTVLETTIFKRTTERVNFRKKKSSDEESIIKTLPKGTKVEVLDDSDDTWCQIVYKGKTGYVHKKFLKD